MKIGDRLRLLREHFCLTQPGAATKFGIPLGSYKQYEKGPSEPGAGALRGLAEGGVNINWLLTGEGEMLLSDQTKGGGAGMHKTIDTAMFLRVLERLSEDDFRLNSIKNPTMGYFAALVYSRVMSSSPEHREVELEKAIKELNLIITDQGIDNLEMTRERLRENPNFPPEDIEPLQKIIDDDVALIGAMRGKFTGRIFTPGGQFESEFLKGLALSEDSDQK
jgi:transcriptional regulator with XRE-family HTH domain